MKQCSGCKRKLPLSSFPKDGAKASGVYPRCKECKSAYDREYAKKNADKKRYVASEWYYANVEKKAVYDKEYRNNNKERKRVNSRQWYANNLDRARLQAKNAGQRRKARKRANGVFYILPKHLTKLYSSKCIYCGSSENIQADHVIPVSRGGVHGIGNLVSACASCNLSKRDKTIMEWRLWKIKI